MIDKNALVKQIIDGVYAAPKSERDPILRQIADHYREKGGEFTAEDLINQVDADLATKH